MITSALPQSALPQTARPHTSRRARAAWLRRAVFCALLLSTSAPAFAQAGAQGSGQPPQAPAGVTPPPDYVIGPEDVLSVLFWREQDMSAEVAVRPDGMITLPLINDMAAAGLTPDQLREQIMEAAGKFVETPSVTVTVKAINSRKVFITGMVGKPGQYALTSPTTVLQLIAMAGGLHEFADAKKIVIMRAEGGKQTAMPFNYKDVLDRKNLNQNIELKPGDTVIVP